MRINYKGMDKDYPYRVAEIFFNENEQIKVDKVIELLEKEGWKIDTVTDGYYLCGIEDYDEYKLFMNDWKNAKSKIRREKHG